MAALLNQTADFKVVAACPSGDPALLRDANPQVILLDVGLWDDDSLRVAHTVRKEYPDSKVIIMDPFYNRKTADFVAARTGAKVLIIPPSVGGVKGANDYIGVMNYDIQQLANAL